MTGQRPSVAGDARDNQGISRLLAPRLRYLLFVVACMAAGLALRWSALDAGMFADDWDQYAMQQRIYPVAVHPLDMFSFVPATDAGRQALLSSGRLPWYAAPTLHLEVLRPLSSALHYLDYAWFDGAHHPERMHIHSFAWWLLLIAALAAVFGELLPLPAAAAAVLLCVVDDAYDWPVVWVANRSALVSIGLATWALWAALVARKRQSRVARGAALSLAVLALLGGEHALAPLAYVAVFELSVGDRRFRDRAISLAPWVIIVLAYWGARTALGYGVKGSAFYIDPMSDPLRYVVAGAVRVQHLLADLWFGVAPEWRVIWPDGEIPSLARAVLPDSWLSLDSLQKLHRAFGATALVTHLAAIIALIAVRPNIASGQANVRWLVLGAFASLVPLTGTESMSRLTVAPSVGFAALFGWVVYVALKRVIHAQTSRLTRVMLVLLVAVIVRVHVVHAAARSNRETRAFSDTWPAEYARVQKADFGGQPLMGRHIIVLDASDFAVQFSLPYMLHFADVRPPQSSEILSPAFANAHVLDRVGPNVLDMRFPDPLLGQPFRHSVYRDEHHRLQTGQVVRTERFIVVVLETSNDEPTHLRFMFPYALEDPRYIFMYSRDKALVRLELPRLGDSIRIPASTKR